MDKSLIFIIIAAVSSGIYQVLNKLIPQTVNSALGATLLSFSAFLVGSVVLIQQIPNKTQLVSGMSGIIFAILAGVSVFLINYFAQSAYKIGLPISVGAPVIIGVSLVIATVFGFFIGEKLSIIKIIGALLIISGTVVITR
ncbi:MAG: EamA family transporter [Candidatus Colwellbacteria bacterium]|nr:EamA family transporter [Candidatus Colwellbacteria bacterium]